MRLRPVKNWHQSHKMWSIRLATVSAVASGLWGALPTLQNLISPAAYAFLSVGFSLAILSARLTKQEGIDD